MTSLGLSLLNAIKRIGNLLASSSLNTQYFAYTCCLRCPVSNFVFLLITFLMCAASALQAEAWLPVTPEEFALKAPRVDKNADAEALFWDVRVTDYLQGSGYAHRVMSTI